MFTCVCVSVSLTSVLPRVQPEFSRPYTAHLMRVGGEGNLSRLESPRKPLTGLQSYDSEKEQLACVCPSGPLNRNPAWLMTEVQSAGFCVVSTPGCRCHYCPWPRAFSSSLASLHRRRAGEVVMKYSFFDDINPPNDSKTAHVSLGDHGTGRTAQRRLTGRGVPTS